MEGRRERKKGDTVQALFSRPALTISRLGEYYSLRESSGPSGGQGVDRPSLYLAGEGPLVSRIN